MDAEERPERVVEKSVPSFKRPGHSNDLAVTRDPSRFSDAAETRSIESPGVTESPDPKGRARTNAREHQTQNIKGFAVCWRCWNSATDATAVTPGGMITSGGIFPKVENSPRMGIPRHYIGPPAYVAACTPKGS